MKDVFFVRLLYTSSCTEHLKESGNKSCCGIGVRPFNCAEEAEKDAPTYMWVDSQKLHRSLNSSFLNLLVWSVQHVAAEIQH